MVLPLSGGAFTKKKVENDRVSIIYPVVRVGSLRDRQVAFSWSCRASSTLNKGDWND